MAKQSNAWKNLERLVAKVLKGQRVLRGADFSKPDIDVLVPDFECLRVDAKYRQKWAHHRYLDDVWRKYCRHRGDMPVLVTKHPHQQGAVVVMDLEHFGVLLEVIRDMRVENEALRNGRQCSSQNPY